MKKLGLIALLAGLRPQNVMFYKMKAKSVVFRNVALLFLTISFLFVVVLNTATISLADEDTVLIQTKLKEKGYDPGPIDGKLGKKTTSALKKYQKDTGLRVTGEVDASTRESIGISDVSTEIPFTKEEGLEVPLVYGRDSFQFVFKEGGEIYRRGTFAIRNGRVVDNLPGSVVVIGIHDGLELIEGMKFGYRDIVVVSPEKEVALAQPGTTITIPSEVEMFGHRFKPQRFIVPSDSKLPTNPAKLLAPGTALRDSTATELEHIEFKHLWCKLSYLRGYDKKRLVCLISMKNTSEQDRKITIESFLKGGRSRILASDGRSFRAATNIRGISTNLPNECLLKAGQTENIYFISLPVPDDVKGVGVRIGLTGIQKTITVPDMVVDEYDKRDVYQQTEPGAIADNAPEKNLFPPFAQSLHGRNEVRVRNPNDFAVRTGIRRGQDGVDFNVPANGVASVFVPNGKYDIFFVYSNKPDALFQGDSFTLNNNGVEIQIVRVVGGNYGIRQVK